MNDFKAMDQAGTCTTAAMDVRPWVNTRNNNIWDCLSSKWTVISGPAQYGVGLTAMGPAATGTDIGSALLPWRNLYLGTAATNNFVITPGATAAARVISIVDPLGAATLAYTNPNAALVQNFTNTSATSLNVVTDIQATTAGAETIGTAAKPFGVLYLGTAATNNLVITPAATGGARVVTAGDPGGADSLAYLAATQTLTGKTLTGAVITDTAKATAQFDAVIGTTGATLTNVVGMVLTVVPGTYRFYVNASGTSTGNGGTKYAFKYGGGAVITSIESTARAFTASAVAVTHQTSNADQAVLEGATAANISAVIEGTMVVGTGGTIQFQAAQNTAHVDTTSVYVGSSMTFTRIL